RRTEQKLALSLLFMLPSAHINRVGVRVVCFRSSIAHPAYTPVYASLSPSRYQRKTRGRVDRWSFLVRILHSLLHAGLSRRTNIPISLTIRVLSAKACSQQLSLVLARSGHIHPAIKKIKWTS